MRTSSILTLLLQVGAVVSLRCACTSCEGSESTCKVGKAGRCFRHENPQGNVTLGCFPDRSDECDNGITECCAKRLCNKRGATLRPEEQPGILNCSCNQCGEVNYCTIDTRRVNGKCLVKMEMGENVKFPVTMGCTNHPDILCQEGRGLGLATCCNDRNFCNYVLMPTENVTFSPESLSSSTSTSTSTSTSELSNTNIPKVTTEPTASFVCYCSNCSSRVCWTSHYCVAADVGKHTEYGCVYSKTSLLFHLCKVGMTGLHCCKGKKCNRETAAVPSSQPLTPTEYSDSTVQHQIPTKCGDEKGDNEMNDSEFIAVLVAITVPAFFIFVTLAGIFVYTARKYHKQADSQRMQGATIPGHSSVSKLSNGKVSMSNGKYHARILED